MEDGWVRHLKGVYVTFGPGATVAAIAMTRVYSSVRLFNLPRECTKASIAKSLERVLDVHVPEAKIDLQTILTGEKVADVTMDNPEFATTLISKLKSDDTVEYKALEVIPSNYRAARIGDITSNKINCSWHKPKRMAMLNFGTFRAVSIVKSRFSRGDYTVNGIRVIPSFPKANDGPNASTWKLKLDNVPATASRAEIVEDIDKKYTPFNVQLGKVSYSIPMEVAVADIIKLLMDKGPLDLSSIMSTEGQGRRYKVTARFVDAADATGAAKLNYNPLPFFADGLLTVQQVFTVRMRFPDHVYTAAALDMRAAYSDWRSNHVSVTVSAPVQGFRSITFEGQQRGHVAEAQQTFEAIMAGTLLTEDGEAIWSASLATNAWAYNQMRALERRLGVLVLCDRQQRTLRLIGPEHVFETAQRQILKLCSLDPRLEFYIRLDADALPWLLRGGYRHIGGVVGRDKIALDVASEPRRLVVSGSEVDLQVAQDLYHNRKQLRAAASGVAPHECHLCGFEAEHPVVTECRHLYCGTCFEDMCLSCAATLARMPAVVCYGDAGQCRAVLGLAAIQERLSSVALERVFERMFATFVGANARQYRYCPTSSCEQVYRVDEPKDGAAPSAEFEFSCPQCQVAICSVCHVSHDTLHCPLRRDPQR